MVYHFAPDTNQEDLAGGRVLYHRGGMPSFPVRLGNEIFRRCVAFSRKKSGICLYDPCCGGAYLLTVLGFLNADVLESVIGSDIDEKALALACDNLSLLTPVGRGRRRQQLAELAALYGREAHRDALESLDRLEKLAAYTEQKPQIRTFRANILQNDTLAAAEFTADIILVDVPYGHLVSWTKANESEEDSDEPFGDRGSRLDRLFKNLRPVRGIDTVTAIISDKAQKLSLSQHHDGCRLDKFIVGKRKIEIIQG